MTRDEITNLVAAMEWVERGHRDGWVTICCPLAQWRHAGGTDNNPSFGISIGDDPPRCVCFACQFSGTLIDVFTDLIMRLPQGTPQRRSAVQAIQGVPVSAKKGPMMPVKTNVIPSKDPVVPETWLQSFPLAGGVQTALSYLLKRNVAYGDAMGMDIRHDPHNDRVGFPIRDFSGQLRGMQGRTTGELEPKYLFYKFKGVACGHEVLLGEDRINVEKPVLLVEGVFDYAALYPYTKQVLVLWGCRVTAPRLRRLERLLKIYTVFDNDKAGEDARKAFSETNLPVTNLVLGNEFADVGELPSAALESLASYVDNYGTM